MIELVFIEEQVDKDSNDKIRLYKCEKCENYYTIPYHHFFKWKHLFCHQCYPGKVWVKEKSDRCLECNKQYDCVYVNLDGTYKP